MTGCEGAMIYLSRLGLPLSVKEGDFDSEKCWFRPAWTLQEAGRGLIIAGDMPDGPMHAKPIDENGNYETELLTRFHKQLGPKLTERNLFSRLTNMQKRVSTNLVDKVAGLAYRLKAHWIPVYDWMRVSFLLVYPGVGLGRKKWRPTWEQVMTEPLPVNDASDSRASVQCDDEMDEDRFGGLCIEKGHVRGLDVQSTEGGDRCGELVVESRHIMNPSTILRCGWKNVPTEGSMKSFRPLRSLEITVQKDEVRSTVSSFAFINSDLVNMVVSRWNVGALRNFRFEADTTRVLEDLNLEDVAGRKKVKKEGLGISVVTTSNGFCYTTGLRDLRFDQENHRRVYVRRWPTERQ
ncbi:hypothetical protein ARMGADRAFT_1077496 [Armillaria gallica]|uniref:Heterokaryon incompatibility domain-containing protein n=1 Tax=Armillaria gallica TaxID=47427 RepID=A0A2H3DL91_ARMGA|nr:hypothetical protein ARMGADRAFT_1077496 [Armillaria gallica]